jgi:hypothetical protein
VQDNNRVLPRKGKNADKNGSYSMAVRVSSAVVDPGETLEIEIYFCGYGEIGPSKFIVYPSVNVFHPESSKIYFGIQKIGEKLFWGGQSTSIGNTGQNIDLTAGMMNKGWQNPTLFFDSMERPAPQLSTEMNLTLPDGARFAPVQLKLVVQRNARPGPHSVQFVFSYFNGESWQTSNETVNFTIRNFYQRNEGLVWFLGAFTAFIATYEGIEKIFPIIVSFLKQIYLCGH